MLSTNQSIFTKHPVYKIDRSHKDGQDMPIFLELTPLGDCREMQHLNKCNWKMCEYPEQIIYFSVMTEITSKVSSALNV